MILTNRLKQILIFICLNELRLKLFWIFLNVPLFVPCLFTIHTTLFCLNLDGYISNFEGFFLADFCDFFYDFLRRHISFDMCAQSVAPLTYRPHVEIMNVHSWINGFDHGNKVTYIDFFRRLLHQNIDALFCDRKNGETNQDREKERTNGISDLPVRSKVNYGGSENHADGHYHVA